MSQKVILVVIDGLTPGLLERALEERRVPVLAELADRGLRVGQRAVLRRPGLPEAAAGEPLLEPEGSPSVGRVGRIGKPCRRAGEHDEDEQRRQAETGKPGRPELGPRRREGAAGVGGAAGV